MVTPHLSISLGLQAAGVLSIQHVPALWIDVRDQEYKVRRYVTLAYRGMHICSLAPSDALESSQNQRPDLYYTQSEPRRGNPSKLLDSCITSPSTAFDPETLIEAGLYQWHC